MGCEKYFRFRGSLRHVNDFGGRRGERADKPAAEIQIVLDRGGGERLRGVYV